MNYRFHSPFDNRKIYKFNNQTYYILTPIRFKNKDQKTEKNKIKEVILTIFFCANSKS